jgi:hypothetical protein
MALVPSYFFYSEGTISLTNGSDIATGNFTAWDPAVLPFDFVFPNDGTAGMSVIEEVLAMNQIRLAKPWTGPTLTDVSYFMVRWTRHTDPRIYAVRVSDYLARLKSIPENIEEVAGEINADRQAIEAAMTTLGAIQTAVDADRQAAEAAAGLATGAADAAAASAEEAEGWAQAASTGVVPDNGISNTKLADMTVNTIKGRVAAGTGDPQDLTPVQARSVIQVMPHMFVNGAYTTYTPGTTMITSLMDGFAFTCALPATFTLPLGANVFPGFSVVARFTGAPTTQSDSSASTPSNTNNLVFNGLAQTISGNKRFALIGGGEIFRFTWTGTEWLIECLAGPMARHFLYKRTCTTSGNNPFPAALSTVTNTTTSGTNTQASSSYNMVFVAPCDGIFRLHAGVYVLANSNLVAYVGIYDENFANQDYYGPSQYTGAPSSSSHLAVLNPTLRMVYGQVAQVGIVGNAAIQYVAQNSFLHAELISRG